MGNNSDCAAFTIYAGGLPNGEQADGSTHLEETCAATTQTLCNAPLPIQLTSEPSISPTETIVYSCSENGRQYRLLPYDLCCNNFTEARRLCQETYGTDLATIITEQDQANAICELNDNSVPGAWIGLNDLDEEGMYMCGSMRL